MGVAKDIHKICTDTYYGSSIYVIFYNLCIVSHIVSPIGSAHLYYERFPFLEFNRETCFRYCETDYFTETYRSGLVYRRGCQYVGRSVCEYYPVVVNLEDVRATLGCKQYTLEYRIYDVVLPTLIYHKGYEKYLPILMHMLGSTYKSYLFRRLYGKNLSKFRTGCDIVGKVVEDYVGRINSKKEKYISGISHRLKSGNKYTSDFLSNLEKLKTLDTIVDGKLMLENVEESARLFDKLSKEVVPSISCSDVSGYSTDLLELVKIIRILGTSRDTPYGV